MAKIAFIGLGNMGIGMAANLAKAGHEVRALDISKDAIARAVEAGCVGAETSKDAVTGADIVISMLPSGRHSRLVYADTGGVFDHATQGALFLDCSTIDVACFEIIVIFDTVTIKMLELHVIYDTVNYRCGLFELHVIFDTVNY